MIGSKRRAWRWLSQFLNSFYGDRLLSSQFIGMYQEMGVGKVKALAGAAVTLVKTLDDHRDRVADHADTAAKAGRLVAAATVAGASIAAPTGLTALGVTIGVVSAPAIITAAPVIVSIAGAAMLFSAAASLYAKARKRGLNRE
ncbi:hypothetical protein [Pseudomonas sp. P1.8]|jgi:hypothetical protein|nr:hypothetical protein [Pseudomonas sp. P1.8]